MKRLVIVGAGGHGKVVADAAEQMTQWDEIVFVDLLFPELKECGVWPVVGKNLVGKDLVGKDIDAKDLESFTNQAGNRDFVVAIGDNETRLKVFSKCLALGFHPISVIHPSSYISPYASIGQGTVVFANAVVNIGASLGRCCIINTGATIDHDCLLGEGVHISPGANLAGEVVIGRESWVGIGASIKQQIQLKNNVTVGAGAAVVSNISAGVTVVGIPAKPIREAKCL